MKRCLIIRCKHGIYQLPHKISNDFLILYIIPPPSPRTGKITPRHFRRPGGSMPTQEKKKLKNLTGSKRGSKPDHEGISTNRPPSPTTRTTPRRRTITTEQKHAATPSEQPEWSQRFIKSATNKHRDYRQSATIKEQYIRFYPPFGGRFCPSF